MSRRFRRDAVAQMPSSGRSAYVRVSALPASPMCSVAFKAAGIPYGQKKDALTFQNLRHAFASGLVQGVKVAGPDGKAVVLAVDVLRVAKLLGDSVDQVIETYGHLRPENLADAVAMIDRKIGRDEGSATPADEIAAMRAEIGRLREELESARAA